MPYIKREDQGHALVEPRVPGELNFALTMRACAYFTGETDLDEFTMRAHTLCVMYLDRVGMSYTNGNSVMGVLDCAAREMGDILSRAMKMILGKK